MKFTLKWIGWRLMQAVRFLLFTPFLIVVAPLWVLQNLFWHLSQWLEAAIGRACVLWELMDGGGLASTVKHLSPHPEPELIIRNKLGERIPPQAEIKK